MDEFHHPLLDARSGQFACVESRATTVFLSEALADFLRLTIEAGLVPVVITRLDAWWTFAARYYVDAVGGLRLVRTDDDVLFDPFTGARYSDWCEIGSLAAPRREVAESGDHELLQAVVSVSVHHPASSGTGVGGVCEVLARELGGCEIAAWGVHEPAMSKWDVGAYTEYVRAVMPEVRTFVSGGGGVFQGVSEIRRSRTGVEETVTAVAPIGFLDSPPESVAHLAAEVLIRVAGLFQMPTLGSVSVLPGWRDGRVPTGRQPLAVPAAILVGPRAVRAIGPDFDALAEKFDVVAAGKARTPSLVASFGDPRVSPWEQAKRIADVFGADALGRAVFGARRPG